MINISKIFGKGKNDNVNGEVTGEARSEATDNPKNITNNSKNKEFCLENFLDYGNVGCRLADELAVKWGNNALTDIIIPSRGAIPFYIAFYSALRECGKLDSDYGQFYKKIKNPWLVERYTRELAERLEKRKG